MGIFRFLLALSVILAHTASLHGFGFVGGSVAVEAFFIISGFYITLILNEKYVNINNSYWLFISNRFLRLFPIYWVVLILTVICALVIPSFNNNAFEGGLKMYQQYGNSLSLTTYLYLFFIHIFILFQETSLYFGVNLTTGNLFFTHNFWVTNPPLWRFTLIPQAWSIGVELLFYLIAPLVVRRRWQIILIILFISMFCKTYAAHHGFGNDPWNYRFFPFELMFFLVGSLAYIIYRKIINRINIPYYINIILLVTLITFTICFTKFNFNHVYYLYITLVFVLIPVVFKFTKNFKIDRFIGELSYPMYITHILIKNIFKTIGITNHLNVLTIVGSLLISLLIIKVIGDRIEKTRQARVIAGKGVNKVPDALSV